MPLVRGPISLRIVYVRSLFVGAGGNHGAGSIRRKNLLPGAKVEATGQASIEPSTVEANKADAPDE